MKKPISVMNALFLLVSLSINVMAVPNEFYGYIHNGGSACEIEEDIDDGCLECYIERQVMKQVAKQLEDTKQQFSSQIEEIKNQRVPSKCFCFDNPVGEIIAFGGINGTRVDSAGYILCDGRELSVLEYPDLFQAIGTIYGASGTNFKVPNYRGMFLRGAGGNALPLGQQQCDAIRNIEVSFGEIAEKIRDVQHQRVFLHTQATMEVLMGGMGKVGLVNTILMQQELSQRQTKTDLSIMQ